MKKTPKKVKTSQQKDKPAMPAPDTKPMDTDQNSNPFDFGGLPARDLKKNLGCG